MGSWRKELGSRDNPSSEQLSHLQKEVTQSRGPRVFGKSKKEWCGIGTAGPSAQIWGTLWRYMVTLVAINGDILFLYPRSQSLVTHSSRASHGRRGLN